MNRTPRPRVTFLIFALAMLVVGGFLFSESFPRGILSPTADSLSTPRSYVFPVYDGDLAKPTMRQYDRLYLSLYRLASRGLDDALAVPVGQATVSGLIKLALPFATVPQTHEEGHRAILNSLGIGSVSRPFLKYTGHCSVTGVTDDTLRALRDTDLPDFIRLYTAGIESDYAICANEKELLAFGEDSFQNVGLDAFPRDAMNVVYMAEGFYYPLFNRAGIGWLALSGDEEKNELDRDVVGDDVCGFAFHLFRPDAPYSRYKTWNDLDSRERRFMARIAARSLLNFANSSYATGGPIPVADSLSLSGNLGYCLAPFGDFIDEVIYARWGRWSLSAYAREFENRDHWFPACGFGVVDYRPARWFSLSARGHLWEEPAGLDFNADSARPGGALEVESVASVAARPGSHIESVGVSVDALYKTKGFLPEVESLGQCLMVSVGLAVTL
jgi:hypothetical protein